MNISKLKGWVACIAVIFLVLGCSNQGPLDDYEQLVPTTVMEQPAAQPSSYPVETVERGKYLISLLGCGTCHTDGALIGKANRQRLLAGSSVGIAYSNPLIERNPGVVYPSNLTPDSETGIGNRSEQQVINMIRSGTDKHGARTLGVMPWPAYSIVTNDDAQAIAAYLKSLPPVKHRVPANVRPGRKATAPFVHFGIYRSKAKIDE